ncbi:hypothetical protein RM572_00550 [Streptomyces sp. DSM 42041]|uniref:Uncharacterized protein n=1 Tax=Streptomyces hazeniae TaxID=3075538 RepID=A0ABU2NJU5_9ACTN|nr:hypothetical protein [Streptomyces sp. DSM 42041]MDT0377265.1 hypothetical protein [Streptomyces sp. DSM 42041]
MPHTPPPAGRVATTAGRLQLVLRHWPDLHALRTTAPHDAWPPPSLNPYMRTAEEYDPTDRSAPVRLHVVDTITEVERVLVDAADRTADSVQRPVAHRVRAAGPGDSIGLQLATATLPLTEADRLDARRWRFTGDAPTGEKAAAWLLDRLDGKPGPFLPLAALHVDRIATAAAQAAERVEHALGLTRRAVPLAQDCACGGTLELHGGDGRPPAVVCSSCSRKAGGMPGRVA